MDKVIYLFGAGASYGSREQDKNGKDIFGHIKRGLPVVNELEIAIDNYLSKFRSPISFPGETREHPYPKLYEELSWLRDKCKEYPTIDTYAKQLSVRFLLYELTRLKNALSVYFSLIQKPATRDLRYDGFVASLIGNDGNLPDNISILSWNYDCQFEYVLNDFSMAHKDVNKVWLDNNIGAKNVLLPEHHEQSVFYKLNGTALISSLNNHSNLIDTASFDPQYAEKVLSDKNNAFKSNISFAWEENDRMMNEYVSNLVAQGTVLVVVGYSFPYVNRMVDKLIVNGMPNLKHIYIQDISSFDVKQSLESILSPDNQTKLKNGILKIDCRESVKQFLIPAELA